MGGWIFRTTVGALAAMALAPALAGAATIKVTETADELNSDGDCSMREAVQAANSNTPVDDCPKGQGGRLDTIKLDAEEYGLTLPTSHEDENANGDLDLGDPDPMNGGGPIRLMGKGRTATDIITDQDDRVLDIYRSSVTIEALGIDGGDVSGLGGGNNLGGNLRAAFGRLTLRDVGVTSGDAGFGGGMAAGGARLVMTRTLVEENQAAVNGGGVYLSQGKSAQISRSTIDDNRAEGDSANGGGIYSGGLGSTSPLRVTESRISNNHAEATTGDATGGGIWSEADLTVRRSLVQANDAVANQAGESEIGGGIFARGAFGDLNVSIANSTLVDNTAGNGNGSGGAIFSSDGAASVAHSTFLGNDAAQGDHVAAAGPPFLTVRNSILPGVSIAVDVCSGSVLSKGFNVANYDDPDCAFLDSDVFGAPGLVPGGPTDNGGPTETIAITGSSLAKDLVPKRKCKVANGEDQRGFERPKGPRCDSGALERGAREA